MPRPVRLLYQQSPPDYDSLPPGQPEGMTRKEEKKFIRAGYAKHGSVEAKKKKKKAKRQKIYKKKGKSSDQK